MLRSSTRMSSRVLSLTQSTRRWASHNVYHSTRANYHQNHSKQYAISAFLGSSEHGYCNGNKSYSIFALSAMCVLSGYLSTSIAYADDSNNDNNNSKDITKIYRRSEVESHKSASTGIWVTQGDGVYDVTEFVANHPGGRDRLMLAAGRDLSEFWKQPQFQLHYKSPLAFELLEELRIGTLHPDDVIRVDPKKLDREPLKYSTDRIYDCIIVGAGVSGLQCASDLRRKHNIPTENILVLEAQDYVGGRVRQMTDFVKGVNVDVGAEFLHGSNTYLTRFAEEFNEPISEIYCWAHGDGGPLQHTVDKGYGLYYIGDKKDKSKSRLLRFDDKDADFVRMNETLWDLASLKSEDYSDFHSLHDYLSSLGFSEEMMDMAAAGFSNTLCTNSRDLSLKQCIKWVHLWHEEEGEDGDFMFKNSFKCLVDKLKENLQIEIRSPVVHIQHPQSEADIMGGLVKVTTERGDTYFTRSLVISSSPYVLRSGKMKFEPELSNEMKEAFDSVNMHNIIKVFLKFSKPAWPKNLSGMIMVDDDFLLPEIWFRDVTGLTAPDEPATAYAVAFTTSDYAARVAGMSKAEVLKQAVAQLDTIFAKLEPKHMSGSMEEAVTLNPQDVPKPSEVFIGGMFWDWNPNHHPYIGGGYCSSKAQKHCDNITLMAKPYGKHIFFAGEATNMPGATAHAALESGVRAAGYVAETLRALK